ncbi:hypothetical protein P7K49_039739, partial [Saguinus oedipus]
WQSIHYLLAGALTCYCGSALLLLGSFLVWSAPGGVSLLWQVASATAGCVSPGWYF